MKTLATLFRFPAALAVLAGFAPFAHAADAKKMVPPPDLQVMVDVPPTWRPFLEDDVAETFFYRLKDVFHQRGYKGTVAQLTTFDTGPKDVPTIRIYLSEWRLDRIGNAQCTFTATLTTTAGEKSLGLKTGTALFWPHGARWGLNRAVETADALQDAANDALRDLYLSVADTGLVAGLEKKK